MEYFASKDFFIALCFQYFAREVGEGGIPAGDIIYIEYIDFMVHIRGLLAIEPLSGPLWMLNLRDSISYL
jgi:hypothetical protein